MMKRTKVNGARRHYGLAFLMVLVLALGYQWFAVQRDNRQFPPPGTFYTVNGHELHLVCSGSPNPNNPTIVLEAGRLGHSMVWRDVMADMPDARFVCAYDRPGLGWSTPAQEDLSVAELNTLLHQLLLLAEVPRPYILAGHGMGGVLVREYAQTYPDDVGGMILVDSVIGHERLLYPDDHLSDLELYLLRLSHPLFTFFSHAGGFRVYHGLQHGLNGVTLTSGDQEWLSRRHQSHFGRTLTNELLLSEHIFSQGISADFLDDIPLYVVEKTFELSDNAATTEIAKIEERKGQQQQLLRVSTASQLLESKISEHHIPVDDPNLVIVAIEAVLQQAAHNRAEQTVISE